MGIRIISTGRYLPDRVLTNSDLEKIVDTSDEWIRTRTGIEERHIAADGQATSDLAVEAARRAMETAGVSPDEIGVIIVATVTPDYPGLPNTACVVQEQLGAHNAFCFDVSAACSGLVYAMVTAYSMMKAMPGVKYALVFGADKLSSIVNWEDRNTCVLFGDGAAAVLMGRDAATEDSILGFYMGSAGSYVDALSTPVGGSRTPLTHENLAQHCIHMNGKEVFKLAVNAMVDCSQRVLGAAGVTAADLKLLIPHQANLRILNAVEQRLGLREDQMYLNVNRYGNTSSASIGLCLDEIVRSGVLKTGDLILLDAFGGGLTWGSILIRW